MAAGIATSRLPARPAFGAAVALGWLRRNLFASPFHSLLTLAAVWFLWLVVPPFIDWAILDAAWRGSSPSACADKEAACWVFVSARFEQIVFGPYPQTERWRVEVVIALAVLGVSALLAPHVPGKSRIGLAMMTIYPLVAVVLLAGGVLGLPPVSTSDWGGLTLTLVVAASSIVVSMPLGLLLALARRSSLPVIRLAAVAFIEFWRGVPLIGVLFMAASMFPLFMPAGADIDKLVRALIAFALFNSAYMAEVFRGGLQAIPRGQYEAARALGLGHWPIMALVVLPQAIRIVIPGIVNTCIGIFKETTLILVIGLFELLSVIQAGMADPEWLIGDHVRETGYLFAALGFWAFCFGMSRYSARLEARLAVGRPTE